MDAAGIAALIAEHFPQAGDAASWLAASGEGWVELVLPFSDEHLRPGGTVSGPTLMTLADTAMYFLVLTHVGRQPLAVTSSLHIDFLRRPAARDVHARAELLRLGRALAVGRVVLTSAGDPRPVAHATVTYALPRSAE
ncbi:MAG: PaaI family thioesterase [Deltaproteobacteria bacterium]|nr:MAG: PaaI family thioesterase [Deltaproteobacteria bacterium]